MPTRKQRRRREKSFRHEYGFVTYDEEGNEVEVDPAELRPEKRKPDRPKEKAAPARGRRPLREPPVPSWNRSLRRGGIWGGLMFVVVVFFFKGQSLASRVAVGALYAAAFVPLTYWIDRVAYRSYLRRSGKAESKAESR
ncbi:MAG TPA: hypothetical protein VFB42_07845 [Gaiellaceae bacterium]|nr:hypothetical protein [Gaiellaceae bacterium]